jgi:Domain of unknown function (DUF4338)
MRGRRIPREMGLVQLDGLRKDAPGSRLARSSQYAPNAVTSSQKSQSLTFRITGIRSWTQKAKIANSAIFLFKQSTHKGLASKILAQSARQLPLDWEHHYGYRPLLLETLVDAQRFRGTCYRAANWIRVGQTQGRGRMDRKHRTEGLAPKDIYLYPLCRNVQRKLCS